MCWLCRTKNIRGSEKGKWEVDAGKTTISFCYPCRKTATIEGGFPWVNKARRILGKCNNTWAESAWTYRLIGRTPTTCRIRLSSASGCEWQLRWQGCGFLDEELLGKCSLVDLQKEDREGEESWWKNRHGRWEEESGVPISKAVMELAIDLFLLWFSLRTFGILHWPLL